MQLPEWTPLEVVPSSDPSETEDDTSPPPRMQRESICRVWGSGQELPGARVDDVERANGTKAKVMGRAVVLDSAQVSDHVVFLAHEYHCHYLPFSRFSPPFTNATRTNLLRDFSVSPLPSSQLGDFPIRRCSRPQAAYVRHPQAHHSTHIA